MFRKRTCSECGKPLGGTLGMCFECGGEKGTPDRDERLADARWWKIMLGVHPEKIDRGHNV